MRNYLSGICIITILWSIFYGLTPADVSAQIPYPSNTPSTQRKYGDMSTVGGNPYQGTVDHANPEGKQQSADSTKKKVRKPLESYLFDDSTRKLPNFVWYANLFKNNITLDQLDTLLTTLRMDYPFQRYGVGDAYLGQLGGPTVPLSYFYRPEYRNFEFAKAFDTYYYMPQTAPHYNVKAPFTQLTYMTSGQKRRLEENFGIIHAQNIAPSTGFNISYKSRGAKGIYQRQKARDKNLSMAFEHTGKKYTVHAGYIYNSVDLRENGGLMNDRDITDTIFEMPETIPVRLKDAQNKLKNNTFYIVQSYGVPLSKLSEDDFSIADKTSFFVGHSLEYQRWTKNYTDTRPDTLSLYKDWFVNPSATHDSIFESLLSNRVFIQLQPWGRNAVIGTIDAGAGLDVHHYYQFVPEQYMNGNLDGDNRKSAYIYGSLTGKFRKYFDWSGNMMFHPMGYRKGDLNLDAKATISAFIKGKPLTLSGEFFYERRQAGYWSENFYSNHYIWSNSFKKENETRFEVTLRVPSIALELGAAQSVLTDKVYYDKDSRPTQYGGTVSVTGLYAQKDFRLGGLHLDHRVLLQWSSAQEVVPVPLASAYLSYFYEFNVVKDVLRVQIGIDGRYNTKYYGFGYNPAIAQFYNQREKEIGEYPLLDAFVAAKWKRMRILLKMQHVNEDLFGSRNYFSILHNPQNMRVLKLGFSWGFYD